MPKLLRFCLLYAVIGAVIGWLFIAALLFFDVGNLGTLVFRSRDMWIALITLLVSASVTFGGASVTTAVLLQAQLDENDRMRLPKFVRKLFNKE